MNKTKECMCINDYSVTCIKYLGDGKHTDILDLIIFIEGQTYFYDIVDGTYFIAEDKKYLRHKNDYNTEVYDMDVDEFNQHFIKK